MYTGAWKTDTKECRLKHQRDKQALEVVCENFITYEFKPDCYEDSISCTTKYKEISGICTFGNMNFRVYALSGIWIFGYMRP